MTHRDKYDIPYAEGRKACRDGGLWRDNPYHRMKSYIDDVELARIAWSHGYLDEQQSQLMKGPSNDRQNIHAAKPVDDGAKKLKEWYRIWKK